MTITLTKEQTKALETEFLDVQEWLQNFAEARANGIITNLAAQGLTVDDVPNAAKRQQLQQAELEKQHTEFQKAAEQAQAQKVADDEKAYNELVAKIAADVAKRMAIGG